MEEGWQVAGEAAQGYERELVPALFAEWPEHAFEAAGLRGPAPGVEFFEGSADALPFDDGSFDAAVMQFGLMYVPDRPRAIAEMGRVVLGEFIDADGRLVFPDPAVIASARA